MEQAPIRAAIVGASTLLGKELAEELNRAPGAGWDVTLLEKDAAEGQVTTAGDEAAILQPLHAGAFQRVDVVFFASDPALTLEHWRHAVGAGAAVVDLSGALEAKGVAVRAPLLTGAGLSAPRLDLQTEAVAAAHPACIMLGSVYARLLAQLSTGSFLSATLLLPASEQGGAGVDELHAQTVALLSFQPLPKDVFDAQISFSLSTGVGGAARFNMGATAALIRRQLRHLLGNEAAERCAFQLVQAPLFHGMAASILVECERGAQLADMRGAMQVQGLLTVVDETDLAPHTAGVTEHEEMQASLRAHEGGEANRIACWVWLVADNLRLNARNAVACAGELLALRPTSRRVQ